jgi:integrase
MKFNPNKNHPAKGDRITVDPIRRPEDIAAISKITQDNPRDHLLFLMLVNNGIRVCDVVKLKVKDVKHLGVGDTVKIIESKTGKQNILVINKTVHAALKNYLEKKKPKADDFLFPSRKGNSHIQSQAVGKLVKKWAKAINLKGNFGCHSLRKAFGFIQRTQFGVGFEILCKRYNHSSPSVTMRYLGIEDKEVYRILLNEIG